MKRFFTILLSLFAIGLVAVGIAGIWTMQEIRKPGTFDTPKEILIEPGTSGYSIAQKLHADGIITQPKLFYALLRLHHATIKAGEYEIPARASMKDTLAMLDSGKMIQRSVTLPEGLTVKQALILLRQNPILVGDITTEPAEGTLLPETYSFTRGDTRDEIIKRMQEAHQKILNELWEKRDPDLPLKSKEEAVTLASIVEKETGKPEERARIAGLFYNRLKIGMPLQTDPTVVYVITNKLGHMGGKRLYSKNMDIDSPYNTYKNVGLPPGPIANPGKSALEAVFNPEQHEYLFFVADGTGGHVFSKDLTGHNSNVNKWRKIKNKTKD